MPTEPQEDLVAEARGFVFTNTFRKDPDRARGFIHALCDEVEKLRRGELDRYRDEIEEVRHCDKCDLCEDHYD